MHVCVCVKSSDPVTGRRMINSIEAGCECEAVRSGCSSQGNVMERKVVRRADIPPLAQDVELISTMTRGGGRNSRWRDGGREKKKRDKPAEGRNERLNR